MTDFTVRLAAPCDAEVLVELARRTFGETFMEDFAMGYAAEDLAELYDRAFTPAAFLARMEHPTSRVWIAERAERALGYASAGPNALPHPDSRPGDGELKQLYVAREAQGLGVGRALLDTALHWLERDGPRTLWIGVWSGNLRAQAVYAGRGFSKAGEYEFPVGRVRDREFILRRTAPALDRSPHSGEAA